MVRMLCSAFCLSFLVAGCSGEEKDKAESTQQPPEAPPLPVEFITTSKDNVPLWIEYTGKTEASKRVEVTARVSGRLEQVLFEEGDSVSEGDILFIIEQDSYEAALERARANLERNQATLELAKKDVERYKPLVAEDLAPRVTLEQYEARVAELEAALKSDDAAIRDAELDLSYTEVTAPISGIISRRFIDVGNVVGPGANAALTTIVSDDPMYVYFSPSEREVALMQRYQSQDRMDAIVNIPDKTGGLLERDPLRGNVAFSDNRVDPMTGTITMRAEVGNPERSILEGTFVYVEIMVTDKGSFLLIPPGIVQEDQQGSYVYVADENDTATRVNITSGYQSRHYLIVTDGLDGNERVLISGFAKLREGMKLGLTDATDTEGVHAKFKKMGMLPEQE